MGHTPSGSADTMPICVGASYPLIFSIICRVNSSIRSRNSTLPNDPFSILCRLISQSPVRSGATRSDNWIVSRRSIRSTPRPVATRLRPFRSTTPVRRSFSMISARVAGVPKPRSFIASASSSSSTSFPAVSMAAIIDASVNRGGAFVSLRSVPTLNAWTLSFSLRSGKSLLSASRGATSSHPEVFTTLPSLPNVSSSTTVSTRVSIRTASG